MLQEDMDYSACDYSGNRAKFESYDLEYLGSKLVSQEDLSMCASLFVGVNDQYNPCLTVMRDVFEEQLCLREIIAEKENAGEALFFDEEDCQRCLDEHYGGK